uniref:WD_REPEATS_REGION domain-containing protein n=1 Tax=Ditylenchus dipsaci TaxID=166011 RepID=A0A915D9N8_9BILA
MPVSVLKNHTGFVNGIAWAPHSTCHICSAAEDCQALIWDVHSIPRPVEDPILAYAAGGEINQSEHPAKMISHVRMAMK